MENGCTNLSIKEPASFPHGGTKHSNSLALNLRPGRFSREGGGESLRDEVVRSSSGQGRGFGRANSFSESDLDLIRCPGGRQHGGEVTDAALHQRKNGAAIEKIAKLEAGSAGPLVPCHTGMETDPLAADRPRRSYVRNWEGGWHRGGSPLDGAVRTRVCAASG